MAPIHAFLQLDRDRAPEQADFVRSRATVLRESGGQFWVAMEDAQVDTFVSQGFTVSTFPDADVLHVGPLAYRPASETPQPPAALRASPPAGDALGISIVHFIAPADKSWLQEIALAGAEQIHVLDAFSGVFRMTTAVADFVRALAYVDSVGLFHPAYAVDLDLAGVEELFTASSLAQLTVHPPPSDPQGNLKVRVFDGLDPADIRPALEAAGATIVAETAHGFVMQAAPEAVNAILAVPGVFAAAAPRGKNTCTHNAGVILGANQVRDLGTVDFLINLDGTGEIGAVIDTGFDVGNLLGGTPPPTGVATAFHPDLANIRLLRNSDHPLNVALNVPDNQNPAGHGTMMAGILAGNGASSGGLARGIAPRAALIGLGPLPGDPLVPLTFAASSGARVVNNSWETNFAVSNNRYTPTESEPIDQWCFRNPDVLATFSAGNQEADAAAGGDGVLDARTLSVEGAAKNALTVGASESLRNDGGWRDNYRVLHPTRYNNAAFNVPAGGAAGAFTVSDNANEVALFSNRGRVRTNTLANTARIKPDVVAPGTNILSTRSQWVAAPPAAPAPPIPAAFYNPNFRSMVPPGINANLYRLGNGTSEATPLVAGSALLVRQFYRTRFAQMRRPLLLEGVAIPAAPPLPVFGSRAAVAPHPDGLVYAWITPALPADQKNIVAMRVGRHQQAPVDAAPVHLQDNVGDHAAPKIVTVGERTYLLHRHRDGKMRLSCYDRSLNPVPGFGTAGVVTLSPAARPDDGVPPDLTAVDDKLACIFPAATGNGYFFQRFRADGGAAIDGASISFLFTDATGPHHALVWNGTRFAACGVAHPGNFQLQVRQMDASGNLQGAAPVTVLDQPKEIREPCLVWDARASRYALAWCDARTVAGGEIWMQFLDANAAPLGAAQMVVSVAAANHMRGPCLLAHPDAGYVLLWEDDSQNGHFDVYLAFLDGNGQVDGRVAPEASDAATRRLVRISDTPADTAGFGVVGDADGFALVYHSPDEVNSDRLGVYALSLTRSAAFEAQEDPATPLLKSGRYVVANMFDHDSTALTALSAVWAGGSYYLLRSSPTAGLQHSLQWVRLHADGAVDPSFGVNGIREVPSAALILCCEMLWSGNDRLITATVNDLDVITLYLHDAQGAPVAAFGAGGAAALQDTVTINQQICPQIGFFTAPAFHVLVGYGTTQGGVLQLRQQRVNNAGVRVGTAVNVASADGVAPHNWFQFVNGENRSIAIYHRVDAGVTRVHCRRFQTDGTQEPERDLSAAAGEGINGVLARRPTVVNSTQREYGAAWQYRANNAAHWEIHFSRLNRQAQPMANPPAPAPPMPVNDVAVINAAMPGWSATRDAVEPQLVCTYTHEPWANPPAPLPAGTRLPEWSPSYGLAWIGVEADGKRALYFTMLDENGRQITVPPPPPPAGALNPPAPVGILQVSAAGTRVQEFKLVWNGRVFLLDWVEEDNGHLHHKVTLVNRHANQIANDIPSAALLRATLVNGATNITPGPLPDVAAGYGWGRVNLRQSLSPAPPVTMHVRDDCAIGPGGTVSYRFTLPAGTALLRVTLNWTDPPGPRLVNHLHLTVHAPAPAGPGVRPEYRGNLWSATAGQTHLSRAVAAPPVAADNHEDIQTFKQVVLQNPPAGIYNVEVSAAAFPSDPFNQQNLQHFALVFAGTGPEVRFNQPVAAVAGTAIY